MFMRGLSIVGLGLALLLSVAPAAYAETLPTVIRFGLPGTVGKDGRSGAGSASNKATVDALAEEFAGGGTKIEWSYFVNAGPGLNEAFAAHQIDFTVYGDFPAVIARSGGIKIKLLAPGTRGTSDSYLVVPADSPAKSIADLKGKRVALNMGRPWVLAFSRLAEANGLKLSDFQLFNLVMPDGDAAVAAHSVDATFTIDGLQLQARGVGKILWSTRDAPLDWKFTAELFGREEFVDKYPETTARIVKAFIRAAHHNSLPENRDEYLREWSESQLIPYDLVVENWKGRDLKSGLSPLFDPYVPAHYQDVIAYALQNKLIRRSFAVDELLEPKFAVAALSDLKLADFWTPVDAKGNPVPPEAGASQ